MIPWEKLDRASIPDSNEELLLSRRGEEYSIRIGNIELMNSRAHFSEEELARLTCERLDHLTAPRILIGGLGMGFTLGAALKHLGPEAQVVVGELIPAVAEWNRSHLAHLAGHPLDDPRARVSLGDIATTMDDAENEYDAILLDVDNGPEGLTKDENSWLYQDEGLQSARKALRPGGILSVWSSIQSPSFTKRMEKNGFDVEVVTSRARKGRGGKHTLWFGKKK